VKPLTGQSGIPITSSKFREASQLKKSNGVKYVLTLSLNWEQ